MGHVDVGTRTHYSEMCTVVLVQVKTTPTVPYVKCVRQCGSVVRALGQQGARVTPHPAGWVSARPRQKNAIETRARVPLASD